MSRFGAQTVTSSMRLEPLYRLGCSYSASEPLLGLSMRCVRYHQVGDDEAPEAILEHAALPVPSHQCDRNENEGLMATNRHLSPFSILRYALRTPPVQAPGSGNGANSASSMWRHGSHTKTLLPLERTEPYRI